MSKKTKTTWTRASGGSVQLTPNFYLAELTHSETAVRLGIENVPNPIVTQNLVKLANQLEQVRAALGNKAILVSSGYRGPELNDRIGGSRSSEHMTGCAADFTAPGFGTPLQICHAIVKAGIPFGQLIFEGTWVHISVADGKNDGQVLTAVFAKGEPTRYQPGLPA